MAEKHEIKSKDHEVWYDNNGVVDRERLGCVVVSYNDYDGSVDGIAIRAPKYQKTEDGEKLFYFAHIKPGTHIYNKIAERVTSKLSKRMENANWDELAKFMSASEFQALKERCETERREEEEARKKESGLITNPENKEDVKSAEKEEKRKYTYNEETNIVQRESGNGITVEYDDFGFLRHATIDVPYNPDGYKPGWSGAPVSLLSNAELPLGQETAEMFSSSYYKRMHNADWNKLEEYAKETGREKEFQEAQKRYEEDKPGWVWRLKVNAEEAVENISDGVDKVVNNVKEFITGDDNYNTEQLSFSNRPALAEPSAYLAPHSVGRFSDGNSVAVAKEELSASNGGVKDTLRKNSRSSEMLDYKKLLEGFDSKSVFDENWDKIADDNTKNQSDDKNQPGNVVFSSANGGR